MHSYGKIFLGAALIACSSGAMAQKSTTEGTLFAPQAIQGCSIVGTISSSPTSLTGDTTGGTSTVDTVPNSTTAPAPGFCSEFVAGGAPAGNAKGSDHIYAFTPGTGANLTFTVTGGSGSFDPMVYILSTCGDNTSCVIGADDKPSVYAPSITYAAFTPGQTYYLYVDSYYNVAGSAALFEGLYTLAVAGTFPVELTEFSID